MFHLGVLFAWQILNLFPVHAVGHLSVLSGKNQGRLQPPMSLVPFTAFLNYSGSSSAIYALLSSTLMAAFVFCPQDTVIRMSEESRRPEKSMARLMMGSTLTNLVIGLPVIVALNYCAVKPIKGLLDESVPGIKAMLETLGNSTGTIFVSLVLLAIFGTGFTRLAMAVSLTHPTGIISTRSEGYPNACLIPLWMRLTHEGSLHYIPGAFSLGRLSRAFHVISIVWLLLLSLLLMLPSTMPVTKNNFNYAPVVLITLAIVFAISWFKARTDFTGGAKDISCDSDTCYWWGSDAPTVAPKAAAAAAEATRPSIGSPPKNEPRSPISETILTRFDHLFDVPFLSCVQGVQKEAEPWTRVQRDDDDHRLKPELPLFRAWYTVPTIPTPASTSTAPITMGPDLLLTRTVQKRDRAALPEIAIAPPSTNSTGESTSQGSLMFQQGIHHSFGSGSSAMQADEGSSKYSAREDYVPRGKIRSSKGRAPTPYPSSLADAEDSSAISEYPSTNEDSPVAPAFTLTVSQQHSKENGAGGYPYDDGAEDKSASRKNIEEAVESTGISQYPTLDGYPLIKSPSTVGEDIARSSGRNNSGSGASGGRSDTLALPSMLPLSRAPTIQQSDPPWNPDFKLADSDEEDDDDVADGDAVRVDRLSRLGLTAEGEDLEVDPLPVMPICSARLQALSPGSRSTRNDGIQPASPSLFLLPNCDISATTMPVVVSSTGGASFSADEDPTAAKGTRAENTAVPSPPPQQQQQQQQQQQPPQRDPIERLLRMSRQQEELDPAQNFLQRTRTVASWAQEQAWIQERRNKRQARAQALRELRKEDPLATLSVHTDSSSFSDRSASSALSSSASSSWPRSMPTQSSMGSGKKMLRDRQPPPAQLMMKRRRSLGVGVGVGVSGGQSRALDSLREDGLMELRRVEMVVPEEVEEEGEEEEEEEEEEPGLYMDTDDVVSPSLEVDSLGAGVGHA
ncbi:hypothetical protein BGZ70_003539 [Mortierella alpina]|uniref:Uncharacterized protein n=1 Tax=Mortierella alpina TaxID=64518 RepID=A0A9P6ITY3_MORAP|nr:hypothetical protein BGZ70_003539 [Mortierella alpina]